MVKSRYFHVSLVFGFVCYPLWLNSPLWYELVLGVVPGLLGFSLSGLAILIGVGSDRFREILAAAGRKKGRPSAMLTAFTNFTHFIAVQVGLLLLAIIVKAAGTVPPPQVLIDAAWFVGFVLPVFAVLAGIVGSVALVYAVLLALATALSLYWIGFWYDRYLRLAANSRRKSGARKAANQDDGG